MQASLPFYSNNTIINDITMKAMIFAAGLGTRLRPLTDTRPKALTEVGGITLLENAILQLKKASVTEIIVNVHHLAEQIADYLTQNDNFGLKIVLSDETEQLLDTGGGLKKAAWFFDDQKPFFVLNADIVSDLDLSDLYQKHLQSRAMATLATQFRTTSRYLLFDENDELQGWLNTQSGEVRISRPKRREMQMRSFSGIQVLNPAIFQFFPEDKTVFSSIDLFLRAAAMETVKNYRHDEGQWVDVGRVEAIAKANEVLQQMYAL